LLSEDRMIEVLAGIRPCRETIAWIGFLPPMPFLWFWSGARKQGWSRIKKRLKIAGEYDILKPYYADNIYYY